MENINLTLKAARANKGYTQKKAGNLLGVSESVISNWERGISFPDALQIKKIEKIYEVPYDRLIFLKNKSN